jgi:hypothetical protein
MADAAARSGVDGRCSVERARLATRTHKFPRPLAPRRRPPDRAQCHIPRSAAALVRPRPDGGRWRAASQQAEVRRLGWPRLAALPLDSARRVCPPPTPRQRTLRSRPCGSAMLAHRRCTAHRVGRSRPTPRPSPASTAQAPGGRRHGGGGGARRQPRGRDQRAAGGRRRRAGGAPAAGRARPGPRPQALRGRSKRLRCAPPRGPARPAAPRVAARGRVRRGAAPPHPNHPPRPHPWPPPPSRMQCLHTPSPPPKSSSTRRPGWATRLWCSARCAAPRRRAASTRPRCAAPRPRRGGGAPARSTRSRPLGPPAARERAAAVGVGVGVGRAADRSLRAARRRPNACAIRADRRWGRKRWRC